MMHGSTKLKIKILVTSFRALNWIQDRMYNFEKEDR